MKYLLFTTLAAFYFAACDGLNVGHFLLDSNTLTYTSARKHCRSHGMDLCYHQQICNTGQPFITEPSGADSWVPVLDQYDDWTQIGDHRKCWRHMLRYGPTSWGKTTGRCGRWATNNDPCPHKKHVLCCDGVQVNNKLTTWDSARAYCQNKGKDLCRSEQVCQNGQPNTVGELSGNHMAPVRNKYNKWISIGTTDTCGESENQSWGTNIDEYIGGNAEIKTRILCCDPQNVQPIIVRPNIFHFYLKSSSLTWTKAKIFCENIPGMRMCSSGEICPDGVPVLTNPIPGDHWAPIRDSPTNENNWIEIGLDNNWTGTRVCWTHDRYPRNTWSDITGTCPPWNNSLNDCPHKGNVFCCAK